IPRRFAFRGRDIRAAVSTAFMADREGGGRLAGIELLKQFLSGPQDLSLSDAANDVSRALWEALGGTTALLYSVYWIRVLRPTRYALDLLARRRRWLTRLNAVMAPWCGFVDAVAARLPPNRFRLRRRELPGDGLDADRLVDCIGRFSTRKSL